MQQLNVLPQSDEWREARETVLFTASDFDKIITPTGKKSTQVNKLIDQKLVKLLKGKLDKEFSGNSYTERGNELEPDAIDCYSIATGNEVMNGGFVVADDGFYGCSPDGLIGSKRCLEIKSVNDVDHVGNMLNPNAYIDHKPQLQGQLLCTKREVNDWMSYHPELPPVIVPVERDEAYIALLKQYLHNAKELLETKKQILRDKGYL